MTEAPLDILTISPPTGKGPPSNFAEAYMQLDYFSLWKLWTQPKWHAPDQPAVKSLMQSKALVACSAGSQWGCSPAPSDHRICESPVSNFSSYCWKLCWSFWGFHYDFPHPQPFISTLARTSNEGPWRGPLQGKVRYWSFGFWPAVGKSEVLNGVSAFQLILLMSEWFQQRYDWNQ